MNDMFREEYIAELAHKKLISSVGITKYEEGYEKGRKEGREEGTKRHALNLYNNGVPKELIIKSLNITEKDLDDLIKENESSK